MTAGVCMTTDSVSGLYLENVKLTEKPGAGQVPADAEGVRKYIAPDYLG